MGQLHMQGAPDKRCTGYMYKVMTSEYIQSSLQLGAGMFVACLFTYILPISFPPMSCVVATWLCVVAVMASPANHVGVRVTSAACVLGSTWLGAVMAAVVVSLSQLAGPVASAQATAVIGVLGPAVLAMLSAVRVAQSPPLLWAQGMNASLAFGLTALTTYTQTSAGGVWHIAGTLVLANTVAAVVVVLVAALIVPTHATEEVQTSIAHVLLLSGVATSRYAGRLFRPLVVSGSVSNVKSNTSLTAFTPSHQQGAEQHLEAANDDSPASATATPPAAAAALADKRGVGSLNDIAPADGSSSDEEATAASALEAADSLLEQLSILDIPDVAEPFDASVDVESGFKDSRVPGFDPLPLIINEVETEQEWIQRVERHSSLRAVAPDASSHPQPQAPVASLRPRLAKAQTLFMSAAAMEPQWLRGGWGTVVNRPGCYWFDTGAWGKAGGCLQLLITRLSALEAVIEDGESLHANQNPGMSPALLNHISLVYSRAASSLAHMSHTVRVYGTNSSTQNPGKASNSPDSAVVAGQRSKQQEQQEQQRQQGNKEQPQSGVQQVSAAAVDAVCGRAEGMQHCWQKVKAELTVLMQEECEGHWVDVMKAAADSPVILPTLTGVRHMMFTWSLTTAIIDTVMDLEQAVTAAVCARPKTPGNAPSSGLSGLLHRLFGWMLPALPMLSGRNQVVYSYNVVCLELLRTLKQGWAGVRSMVSSPLCQAGFKYWLVLCIVFEVTLMVLYALPLTRPLNPSFGFVAASLTMSERVEATVSKFVFWVTGTILGGALGYLAMWHPALALSPYGLVAVVVGVALVVGLLGVTKARVGITLVLMTLSSLILCQCCQHVGSYAVALSRVTSVIFGITTAVLVSNLLLPWYTSSWSIDTMRSAFITAVQLFGQMHAQFYADGAAAVAAFEAQAPRCPPRQHAQQHPTGFSDAAAASERAEDGLSCEFNGAAAVAAAAVEVAAAAGASSEAIAHLGHLTCPMVVTPAGLQSIIARPLVAVQTSLLMDTVMWQRGVLSTPPVVPALLRAMFGLLDRLAGLQLTLQPPSITSTYTGAALVNYGVPMAGQICGMLHLCGKLAAAVSAVLEEPSCAHSRAVQDAVSALHTHRASMYTHMQQLRQQLHIDVLRQHRRLQQLLQEQQQLRDCGERADMEAQICPVKRQMSVIMGGVDDVVRYMGFQFAVIKVLNMMTAVANVAAQETCRARNSKASTLK